MPDFESTTSRKTFGMIRRAHHLLHCLALTPSHCVVMSPDKEPPRLTVLALEWLQEKKYLARLSPEGERPVRLTVTLRGMFYDYYVIRDGAGSPGLVGGVVSALARHNVETIEHLRLCRETSNFFLTGPGVGPLKRELFDGFCKYHGI